ncbi:MAG: ATP-dependent sacrificial sulfur transferase LarE [Planctomycetota bacterium]
MVFPPESEPLLERLRAAVPAEGRLAVAFSGGVDSSLLLALAVGALGRARVLAVTAVSPSLAGDELAACQALAAELGVEHRLLETRELERQGYRDNAGDRCYHCKSELFERVEELAGVERLDAVAYGATRDDLGDWRPGLRAAREHRALAPLADAGLGKDEVRALSRALGLAVWDKPAHPCLASRVPYGQAVTAEKLGRIEGAERLLRGLGLRELRVREHEQETPAGPRPLARVEVPAADLARLVSPGVREAVTAGLRALGYEYVTLDLEGLRSGRLNEVLGRKLPQVSP